MKNIEFNKIVWGGVYKIYLCDKASREEHIKHIYDNKILSITQYRYFKNRPVKYYSIDVLQQKFPNIYEEVGWVRNKQFHRTLEGHQAYMREHKFRSISEYNKCKTPSECWAIYSQAILHFPELEEEFKLYDMIVVGNKRVMSPVRIFGDALAHIEWIEYHNIDTYDGYNNFENKPRHIYKTVQSLINNFPDIMSKTNIQMRKASEQEHIEFIIMNGITNPNHYRRFKNKPTQMYKTFKSLEERFPNIMENLGWKIK